MMIDVNYSSGVSYLNDAPLIKNWDLSIIQFQGSISSLLCDYDYRLSHPCPILICVIATPFYRSPVTGHVLNPLRATIARRLSVTVVVKRPKLHYFNVYRARSFVHSVVAKSGRVSRFILQRERNKKRDGRRGRFETVYTKVSYQMVNRANLVF